MKIFGLVIMTKKKFDEVNHNSFVDGVNTAYRLKEKSEWSAINPVIHDLERLRANTWDQDKITHIQEWLKHNFKVKN